MREMTAFLNEPPNEGREEWCLLPSLYRGLHVEVRKLLKYDMVK